MLMGEKGQTKIEVCPRPLDTQMLQVSLFLGNLIKELTGIRAVLITYHCFSL